MASFQKLILTACVPFMVLGTVPTMAADTIETWAEKARKSIAGKQRYPSKAIDDGIEGTVVVSVTVSKSGSITAFNIRESSNQQLLDDQVLGLLARANPLPALPDGHDNEKLIFPLTYKLTKSVKVGAKVDVSGPETIKEWGRMVSRKFARKQSYPAHLIDTGVEGVVTVELMVDGAGNITAQRVSKSSGHELLDMEALSLAQQISPLPALPDGREKFKVNIPLNYRISE